MKLTLGLVACLLASVSTKSFNSTERDDEFKHEHWYEYEGQAFSGIPSLKQQYAGLGIKCRVVIHKLTSGDYLMRLERVKVAKFNREFSEPFTKKLRDLVYTEDLKMAKELIRPIKFERVDGLVQLVKVYTEDKYWSLNVKKAILSLFNVNHFKIRQGSRPYSYNKETFEDYKTHKEYRPVTSTSESGIEGTCETLYQVYPVGQGPWCQAQLRKEVREEDLKVDPRKLLQVTKIRNLQKCSKRPVIIQTDPSVKICKDCDSEDQRQISESGKYTYLMKPHSLMIQEVMSEGETVIPSMGEHSAVLSTTQILRLVDISSASNYTEPTPRPEYVKVPSLIYTVPSSLRQRLTYFEPLTSSPSAEKDTEHLDPEEGYGQDFLRQHLGQTSTTVKLTDAEKKLVIKTIRESLNELSKMLTRYMTNDNKPNTRVSMWNMARIISYLNTKDLKSLYEKIVSDESRTREQRQIERKLYLDCTAMAGSAASIKALRYWIDTEKLKGLEAADVASGLQESVVLPNKFAMNELVNLCHLKEVRQNQLLHSAVCISVGQIIEKTCYAPHMMKFTSRPLVPRVCKQEQLKRVIDKLAEKLQTAPEYRKATYIQALAHTGSKHALRHIKPYILEQKWSEVLRSSAISALRRITKYHPHQVMDIVLPIYNNRAEKEVVRIAASSVIFASRPSYSVVEKMAVDLTRETDNQVGSFVYTTLHSLANTTVPCLHGLSVNASKAVKLAKPFKLDRTSSYKYIIALQDFTKHVQILSDTEYVTSKRNGLPKYASYGLSMITPGNILNKLYELRMQHNGIDRKIMSKLFGEKKTEELPPYLRNIVEKLTVAQPPMEKMEGDLLVKVFERTLYSYVSENNYDRYYEQVKKTIENIREKLRHNVTTHYVKALLPLRSSIIAPSPMGLPVPYFQTTDILCALKLDDVRLEVESKEYFEIPESVVFSGTIKPFVWYQSSHMIGIYNPSDHKMYAAGHYKRYIVSMPFYAKLHFNYQDMNMTLFHVLKPKVAFTWAHHLSKPFTVISDIYTMKPLYDHAQIKQIKSNPHVIKYNKDWLQDTFGIGVRVSGYSENPWSLHTRAWFKQMKCPVYSMPAGFVELILNPWLYRREINLQLVRGDRPTKEIQTYIRINKHNNYEFSEADVESSFETMTKEFEKEFENMEDAREYRMHENQHNENHTYTAYMKMTFKGQKDRKITAVCKVKTEERRTRMKWYVHRTPLSSEQSEPAELCAIAESRRGTYLGEEDEESLYNPLTDDVDKIPKRHQRLTVRYGRRCRSGTKIIVTGTKVEVVKTIRSLPQPDRALAHEVKRKCEKEKHSMAAQQKLELISNKVPVSNWLSRVCRLALNDKASLVYSKFNVWAKNVTFNLTAPAEYMRYMLYPYMEITRNKEDEALSYGRTQLQFRTIRGVDVTTLHLVRPEYTYRFENVHHRCPIINCLLSLPAKFDPRNLQNILPTEYLLPHRGICRLAKSYIRTYDHVTYPFTPKSKCEFVVSQDVSPAQRFIVTLRRQSESGQSKVVKILIGSKLIEIIPKTRSEDAPIVKIDDVKIQLGKGKQRIVQTEESTVKISRRYHKSLHHEVIEVQAKQLGLKVETDGKEILVKAPRMSRGQLIGLCGNNNGEKTFEMRGPHRNVHTETERFIDSYKIPSEECVKNTYVVAQSNSAYEQDRPSSEGIIMRNKVETRGSRSCFSTLPQRKCASDYEPTHKVEKTVEFHCIQSETKKAEELKKRADKEVLHELKNKSVDYEKEYKVPVSCKQAAYV